MPSNARRVHHGGSHLLGYTLVEGTARCSSYLFGSIDDMIFIPPHGVQKHPGRLWDRRETDHNPGGVFGQCLNHLGKQLSWHHLAGATQEVQLEIAEGIYWLVQVQFGHPGGELYYTTAIHGAA